MITTGSRPAGGTVDPAPCCMRDVLVTGCGRVYVFPGDLPQVGRLAGFNQFAHRVGYVERDADLWVAQDLGTVPLGPAMSSRREALERVLRHLGWDSESFCSPAGRVVGRAVRNQEVPDRPVGEIVIDELGLVAIEPPRRGRAVRDPYPLGSVWRHGERFATLKKGAHSATVSEYGSLRTAIQALLPAGAFVNSRDLGFVTRLTTSPCARHALGPSRTTPGPPRISRAAVDS